MEGLQDTSRCPVCGTELPPRSQTGRPRRFCSATCRSAARRARQQEEPALGNDPPRCSVQVSGRCCERQAQRLLIVNGEETAVCDQCAHVATAFIVSQGVPSEQIEMIFLGSSAIPASAGGTDRSPAGARAILLIEDDPTIRSALHRSLTKAGYGVTAVGTALDGLREATSHRPDMIVLDLGLPDLDGADALRMLRGVVDVPVIIATARDNEREIVRLLNSGADDYLVKPFSFEHLTARMEATFRGRNRGAVLPAAEVYEDGLLRLEPARRSVRIAGHEIRLTPVEFRLLDVLVRNSPSALPTVKLLIEVWGDSSAFGGNDRVKLSVLRLRRKLGWSAESGPLEVVRGVGYRYRAPSSLMLSNSRSSSPGHAHRLLQIHNNQTKPRSRGAS